MALSPCAMEITVVNELCGRPSLEATIVKAIPDFTQPSSTVLATRIYFGDKNINFNIK
jgi:hypothetical protein